MCSRRSPIDLSLQAYIQSTDSPELSYQRYVQCSSDGVASIVMKGLHLPLLFVHIHRCLAGVFIVSSLSEEFISKTSSLPSSLLVSKTLQVTGCTCISWLNGIDRSRSVHEEVSGERVSVWGRMDGMGFDEEALTCLRQRNASFRAR